MSKSAGAEQRDQKATSLVRHRAGTWRLLVVLPLLSGPAVAEDSAGAHAGDASFALGVVYDLGRGVTRDDRLACRYYSDAGNHGHVGGAFNAAVMFDSGRCGNTRRADLAAIWYGRAAAAGAGRAQFNLALLYASGDGVPRNPAVAAAWFRTAAANGVPAAAGRVAELSRSGGHQGPLLPAVPVFPAPAQSLVREDAATLVWTAPDQPPLVRFFVEAYALKPSGPVEIAARYLDVTSVRVPLLPDATQFTWRVLTVGIEPPRYAAGPWTEFSVAPVASGPR